MHAAKKAFMSKPFVKLKRPLVTELKRAAGIFALRPTGLKIGWFYKMVDPPFSPGPQRLSQIFMSGE
jgi:hypothetical protein